MLETVPGIGDKYYDVFHTLEWIVTALFTVEYGLRIWSSQKPRKYIFGFYGVIDFLSIIPTFLGLIFPGAHLLAVIRTLRLLRLFRVLKLTNYTSQGNYLLHALRANRQKLAVFLFSVVMIITIIGTIMFLIEGPEHGFTSIPEGVYWAVVTVTTVGFGDITPSTGLGKFVASFTMILGYAIIAVPTGIISAEVSKMKRRKSIVCCKCKNADNDDNANYCKICGTPFSVDIDA